MVTRDRREEGRARRRCVHTRTPQVQGDAVRHNGKNACHELCVVVACLWGATHAVLFGTWQGKLRGDIEYTKFLIKLKKRQFGVDVYHVIEEDGKVLRNTTALLISNPTPPPVLPQCLPAYESPWLYLFNLAYPFFFQISLWRIVCVRLSNCVVAGGASNDGGLCNVQKTGAGLTGSQ